MTAPDVSIVTVTYECRELVRHCLDAIPAAAGGRSYEVVIADNRSSDGVLDMLREEYPAVQLIEMGSNTGFARANNRAIAASRGRFILLLNPDTTPSLDSIDLLAAFLDRTPTAGVVAPRLLNSDLTDQGTARSFPTAAAAIFGRRSVLSKLFPANRWTRRYLSGRSVSGSAPFEVDWVSGAALMIRRAVIDRVGGLDEGFFMYWEDADWCHRIKNAGHGVYCLPTAEVVHAEGGSRRVLPLRQLWAFHHGAYRYYAKHHAPQTWNPLRYVAIIGLSIRALAMIAAASLSRGSGLAAGRREETL